MAPASRPETTVELGALPRPLPTEPDTFVLADAQALAAHPSLLDEGPAQLVLEGGEECKTLATLERVLRSLAKARIGRDGRLVAVGGGAVLDLGGLAASLYMRGIGLELVPTTLLAMCDASIGGKTAVDLPEGKNLVGTFWPARRVRIDVELLATLPEEELVSGLAEVLKIALGFDAALLDLLERRRDAVFERDLAVLREVVERAVHAKLGIVRRDPRERGPRRLLNLGHTVGHALEAHSGYGLRHGSAVGRGLHAALDFAERRGSMSAGDVQRARALLAAYGFERWPLPPVAELLPFLEVDKKAATGGLRFVLPTGLGRCEIVEGLTARDIL